MGSSYPYQAVNGQCKYQSSEVVAHITGWRWATTHKNESEILAHLQAWGPLHCRRRLHLVLLHWRYRHCSGLRPPDRPRCRCCRMAWPRAPPTTLSGTRGAPPGAWTATSTSPTAPTLAPLPSSPRPPAPRLAAPRLAAPLVAPLVAPLAAPLAAPL